MKSVYMAKRFTTKKNKSLKRWNWAIINKSSTERQLYDPVCLWPFTEKGIHEKLDTEENKFLENNPRDRSWEYIEEI